MIEPNSHEHMKNKEKLSQFQNTAVSFVETQTVKEGVECDIYTFDDDKSKDLAIVRVTKGFKTPLQKIILGNKTTEGFLGGRGTLTIGLENGENKFYVFDDDKSQNEVSVNIGQTMQWAADKNSNLTFYEICYPPYEDGRFENLPE